jgi:hypothetical protein
MLPNVREVKMEIQYLRGAPKWGHNRRLPKPQLKENR